MAVGRNLITTRISLEGAQEVIKLLKEIGQEGVESLEKIQHAAQKVQGPPTQFQARMAQISQSLKSAGAATTAFGKQVAGIGASFSLVSAAVATTIFGFTALAKVGGEAADEMLRNAQSAGLTIDEFAKLSHAAKEAEVSTETFTTSMARLSKNIVAAANGNQTAAKAFGDLKVAIEKGGKIRPTIDIVTDLVNAFNKLPDGAKKSASAIALFGRGGAQLIPFLNTTNEALQQQFKDVERLGLGFTKAEAEIGDKFSDTVEKIFAAVTALRNHIGIIFAPTLQKVADSIVDFIASVRQPILDAVQSMTDAFNSLPAGVQVAIATIVSLAIAIGPLLLALGLFIQLIGFALSGLGSLALIIPGLVTVFSTLGSAITGLGAVLGVIVGFFGTWTFAIVALIAALVFLGIEIFQHWPEIKAVIISTVDAIVAKFEAFKEAATRVWNSVSQFVIDVLNSILEHIDRFGADVIIAFRGVFDPLFELFDLLESVAKDTFEKVVNFLSGIIERAAIAARAITNAAGITRDNPAGAPGKRGGGLIRGPGTSTSDSIPIWASAREFMIKAAAVRKYGVGVFAALNSMRLPRGAMQGFSVGGLVERVGGMPSMRFAAGGMVPALAGGGASNVLNLSIDGETFTGLLMPEDTAERLTRFARSRQIRSAGRSPHWRGGN